MAYCPKCKKNYPIVTSIKGSSRRVPTTTERYNSEGDYIGYEESETYGVNTETLPRCSNCYSVFKFPNAISKEELFYAKRDKLKCLTIKPIDPGSGGGIWTAVIFGGIAGIVAAALTAGITMVIIVGVGVGYGVLRLSTPTHLEKKKYEDKMAHWNKKLKIFNELKSLTYSDENYERLLNSQLSKEALEKHKEVWRRIKLREAGKGKNN